jgi:thiol-disulfide isomerase/thioredoxin
MMKNIFIITLLVTPLLFSVISLSADSNAEVFSPWKVEKLVGAKAPGFTAKDLTGNDVSLSSFEGSPILLNFWATWCPYCRKERPYLNSLFSEFRDKGPFQ